MTARGFSLNGRRYEWVCADHRAGRNVTLPVPCSTASPLVFHTLTASPGIRANLGEKLRAVWDRDVYIVPARDRAGRSGRRDESLRGALGKSMVYSIDREAGDDKLVFFTLTEPFKSPPAVTFAFELDVLVNTRLRVGFRPHDLLDAYRNEDELRARIGDRKMTRAEALARIAAFGTQWDSRKAFMLAGHHQRQRLQNKETDEWDNVAVRALTHLPDRIEKLPAFEQAAATRREQWSLRPVGWAIPFQRHIDAFSSGYRVYRTDDEDGTCRARWGLSAAFSSTTRQPEVVVEGPVQIRAAALVRAWDGQWYPWPAWEEVDGAPRWLPPLGPGEPRRARRNR